MADEIKSPSVDHKTPHQAGLGETVDSQIGDTELLGEFVALRDVGFC
jgi:hypothetical protein